MKKSKLELFRDKVMSGHYCDARSARIAAKLLKLGSRADIVIKAHFTPVLAKEPIKHPIQQRTEAMNGVKPYDEPTKAIRDKGARALMELLDSKPACLALKKFFEQCDRYALGADRTLALLVTASIAGTYQVPEIKGVFKDG